MQERVDQLVAAICRPGDMKDRVQDPGVNITLCVQEVITCASFVLKHQWQSGISPYNLSSFLRVGLMTFACINRLKKHTTIKLHLQTAKSRMTLREQLVLI